MIINVNQAREILGVGKTTFQRLINEGKITPVNTKKDGAKRFSAKFDFATIRTFGKASRAAAGTPTRTDKIVEEIKKIPPEQAALNKHNPPAVHPVTILSRIETKIDALLAAWGITVG